MNDDNRPFDFTSESVPEPPPYFVAPPAPPAPAGFDGSGVGGSDPEPDPLQYPEPLYVRREHRRLRALVKLLCILAVPAIAAGAAFLYYNSKVDASTANGKKVAVKIEQGWSTGDIADQLAEQHVIDDSWVFKVYARVEGKSNFQAGNYVFREGMGIKPAIVTLEAGPKTTRVTLKIRPGLWLDEVGAQVAKQLKLDATKFVDLVRTGAVRSKYQPADVTTTEGLLFPDTYFFTKDVTELDVVKRMVARFDEIADEISLEGGAAARDRNPYDIVKVASIVEMEVRLSSEKPLVASVIYNRLKSDMLLQIDATVLYSIGERKPSTTENDRQTNSPFNTYRFKGLGPNPMATVSKSSLKAALVPADTNYLYYVLISNDGRQAFAATYSEHLANVAEARRLGLLK